MLLGCLAMDKEEFKVHETIMTRARFTEFWCELCKNIGVIKVRHEGMGTLALCSCEQGQRQPWGLPKLNELGKIERHSLSWEAFHPGVHAKEISDEGIKRFIGERVEWWREKIKTAEAYWSSQKGVESISSS